MNNKPLITIGITCFNAAGLVHRAIESALAQTWPNFEVLIVDDGSADESLRVLGDFAARDSRIRIIPHETNKGFPAALNTLFRNANGDFIALFDDDDTSEPRRLEKQYERLIAYEEKHNTRLVFCYTNRLVYDHHDMKHPVYPLEAIGRLPPEPHGPMVADFLLWSTGQPGFTWGMFGSCTLLVRKKSVEDLEGFDECFRRCAEWDLAVRAALAGAHFIAVSEPLVHQLKTPTADKKAKIPLQYALMLRHKHKRYLQQRGRFYYWAALALAHARFWGANGRKIRSLFYRLLNEALTRLNGPV